MNYMKEKKKKYDLLIINCGLHDVRIDRKNLEMQTNEDQYKENLNKIINLGKQLADKLIWITTTHVNDAIHNNRKDGYLRYNKDVIKYNEIANKIMKLNNIKIIDLYDFTKKLENNDMYRDHVHFKDNISKQQAEFIYKNIEEYL